MYCRNNWLKYDFGGLPQRARHEDLNVHFTAKASVVLPLKEAAISTAREIYSQYKDIYVCMSGGCDSEFVAQSFLDAGIPFTPITLTCGYYLKFGEWYINHWCDTNNIPLVKYEVSPEEFISYGKKAVGKLRAMSWYGATMTMLSKEIKRRGGYMVTGALPAYHPDPKLALAKADPTFAANYRGFMIDEADFYAEILDPDYHPWGFFYWSPEMLASVIHNWDTSQPCEENKWRMFNSIPRSKLTGSEIFMSNYVANQLPEYQEIFKWTKAHIGFNWGTRDFAICADRDEFLKLLTT
jgi:hypothetical protein